jgi:hypothetical protein
MRSRLRGLDQVGVDQLFASFNATGRTYFAEVETRNADMSDSDHAAPYRWPPRRHRPAA